MGGLGLAFSVTYFSVTVIKRPDQGSLKREGLIMGLWFQRYPYQGGGIWQQAAMAGAAVESSPLESQTSRE